MRDLQNGAMWLRKIKSSSSGMDSGKKWSAEQEGRRAVLGFAAMLDWERSHFLLRCLRVLAGTNSFAVVVDVDQLRGKGW